MSRVAVVQKTTSLSGTALPTTPAGCRLRPASAQGFPAPRTEPPHARPAAAAPGAGPGTGRGRGRGPERGRGRGPGRGPERDGGGDGDRVGGGTGRGTGAGRRSAGEARRARRESVPLTTGLRGRGRGARCAALRRGRLTRGLPRERVVSNRLQGESSRRKSHTTQVLNLGNGSRAT